MSIPNQHVKTHTRTSTQLHEQARTRAHAHTHTPTNTQTPTYPHTHSPTHRRILMYLRCREAKHFIHVNCSLHRLLRYSRFD